MPCQHEFYLYRIFHAKQQFKVFHIHLKAKPIKSLDPWLAFAKTSPKNIHLNVVINWRWQNSVISLEISERTSRLGTCDSSSEHNVVCACTKLLWNPSQHVGSDGKTLTHLRLVWLKMKNRFQHTSYVVFPRDLVPQFLIHCSGGSWELESAGV